MALIGEARISASVQVLCDRITSAEFADLFGHKKLDKPLLMKLNTTLLTLNVVLDDAEEKKMVNPAVRKWLDELKHAVFDAKDLLDEIDTEALRRKPEGEDQIDKLTNKVWNFLSSSHNHFYQSMNVKIQELLQRLESFVQQKSILGLGEGVGRQVSQRTQTTSLVHEPCFHGRDEVISELFRQKGSCTPHFSSSARKNIVSKSGIPARRGTSTPHFSPSARNYIGSKSGIPARRGTSTPHF